MPSLLAPKCALALGDRIALRLAPADEGGGFLFKRLGFG